MSEESQEEPKPKMNKIVNKNFFVEALFVLSYNKVFLY